MVSNISKEDERFNQNQEVSLYKKLHNIDYLLENTKGTKQELMAS